MFGNFFNKSRKKKLEDKRELKILLSELKPISEWNPISEHGGIVEVTMVEIDGKHFYIENSKKKSKFMI